MAYLLVLLGSQFKVLGARAELGIWALLLLWWSYFTFWFHIFFLRVGAEGLKGLCQSLFHWQLLASALHLCLREPSLPSLVRRGGVAWEGVLFIFVFGFGLKLSPVTYIS